MLSFHFIRVASSFWIHFSNVHVQIEYAYFWKLKAICNWTCWNFPRSKSTNTSLTNPCFIINTFITCQTSELYVFVFKFCSIYSLHKVFKERLWTWWTNVLWIIINTIMKAISNSNWIVFIMIKIYSLIKKRF